MRRRTKAIVEAERLASMGIEATSAPALVDSNLTRPAFATSDIPEPAPLPTPPADWRKGALLNVRLNRGDYVITLYPEEIDDQHPDRALRFSNVGECQNFVSAWYSRESPDPRAIR